MKLLLPIVIALLLGLWPYTLAQTNEQHQFVKKFDRFLKTNTAKLSLSALDSASTLPVPMPNAIDATKTRIPDPITDLWHYPNLLKVYDPETGYYIDYEGHHYYCYKTDTVAGIIYKGKTPVELKRIEKVQK